MDDRVRGAGGAAGSGASMGRRRGRRRLRVMRRGYRIARWTALYAALVAWSLWLSPVMAESGSRYSAPLWTWITAIVVSAALSVLGLAIGVWFLRKRKRLDELD